MKGILVLSTLRFSHLLADARILLVPDELAWALSQMPGSCIWLSQTLLSCNSCEQGHFAGFFALNQINHKLLKGNHCLSLVILIKIISNMPSFAVQITLPWVMVKWLGTDHIQPQHC